MTPTTKTTAAGMENLAGKLGIQVHYLRAAKKQGSTGFHANGSIDTMLLLRWLLSRGTKFKPGRSLEAERADWVAARREKLEREAALAHGELVSSIHVYRIVEGELANVTRYVDEQLRDTFAVEVQGATDEAKGEIRRQLFERAQLIHTMVRHCQEGIFAGLSKTPEGGPTLIGRFLLGLKNVEKAIGDKMADVYGALKPVERKIVADGIGAAFKAAGREMRKQDIPAKRK
jgi:hypothetical protein